MAGEEAHDIRVIGQRGKEASLLHYGLWRYFASTLRHPEPSSLCLLANCSYFFHANTG